MQPLVMAVLLSAAGALFAVTVRRRWTLWRLGRPLESAHLGQPAERLLRVIRDGLPQRRMRYHPLAGAAHRLIFLGFLVLLVRTLVLLGRGFDPAFDPWPLGDAPLVGVPIGHLYGLVKDISILFVLAGVAVFSYLRLVRRERRLTLNAEGLIILGIIAVMMGADLLYDGAAIALAKWIDAHGDQGLSEYSDAATRVTVHLGHAVDSPSAWLAHPAGSALAALLTRLRPEALIVLSHAGFWAHVVLVLAFLNLLPYSKHFHVVTAIPNLFLSDRGPPGRLRPLAPSSEALMDRVDVAARLEDPTASPLGVSRISHFDRKDLLDLFTCTECGRCSDRCPATITGKKLSPKHLTLALRDHLYAHGTRAESMKLVPQVIDPDVAWACTTCRACEEECPAAITYVNKIVELRRPLVMVRGEFFPRELAQSFEAAEATGNPWGLSPSERLAWAKGLDVPTLREKPDAALVYWVGCAAAYDAGARRTARALVRLLQTAGVDFAVLGVEERCTGDAARRAGNEFLFATLAEANVSALNGYQQRGGVKRVVTACPHCYNTLLNEYPDFGGHYAVAHHSELLLELVQAGKLKPRRSSLTEVAFHDPCYLGRHNGLYDPPRELLALVPGVALREVPGWNRERALCCGAGGAQMWMKEQNQDRVSARRAQQLIDTGADVMASSCPFCITSLTDGARSLGAESAVANRDIAELLAIACDVES